MRLIIGIIALLPMFCMAQENLVRNGSFEELTYTPEVAPYPCPNSAGEIFKAKFCRSAAASSVDYFNSCSAEFPEYSTPINLFGTQEPVFGNAYAVIGCYSSLYADAREYLLMELSETLQAGKTYELKSYVSLTDSMNFAISRIGAFFSEESTRYWDVEDLLNVNPQVENAYENLLFDKNSWTLITGTFMANGDERFITIGCFRQDSDENIQRVSDHPVGNYFWDESAYYIDDVSVIALDSVPNGIAEEAAIGFDVWPNPATDVVRFRVLDPSTSLRVTVRVLDAMGREVTPSSYGHSPLQGGEPLRLNISGLSKGVYFLELIDGEGRRAVRKFVKE